MIPLRPESLNDWAATDMAWWHLLLASRAAWEDGRQGASAARKAIEQATAHLRRK